MQRKIKKSVVNAKHNSGKTGTANKAAFLLFVLPFRLELGKMRDSDLNVKADALVSKVLNNPSFQQSQPKVQLLEQINLSYAAALATGTTLQKAELRIQVTAQIRNVALACWVECNGDKNVFATTGIDFIETPQHVNELSKPERTSLSQGPVTGSIKLMAKPVKKARSYQTIVYLENGTVVKDISTPGSRVIIFGLTQGTCYYVKVAACGRPGVISEWTEAGSIYCA